MLSLLRLPARALAMVKKRVKVGVPTLRCYDKLIRLCRHLLNDSHPCIEAEILILDNGGKIRRNATLDALEAWCPMERIKVASPPYNLGVPKSWNYLLEELGQCIITNDDALFGLEDIACFLKAAETFPDTFIFETDHPIGGFSTFYANKPELWMAMGGFDELLSPAYFEDNDCRWRLKQAGVPVVPVKLPSWSHDNSSTLHSGDEDYKRNHWCCFERNKAYYQKKWGGLPGDERFVAPFCAKEWPITNSSNS
jgi:hypothetical protein